MLERLQHLAEGVVAEMAQAGRHFLVKAGYRDGVLHGGGLRRVVIGHNQGRVLVIRARGRRQLQEVLIHRGGVRRDRTQLLLVQKLLVTQLHN